MKTRITTEQDFSVKLCGLDFVGGFIYIRSLVYLKHHLDVDKFAAAISTTIASYPYLAGTVVIRDGAHYIEPGIGVEFEYDDVDVPCPPVGLNIPVRTELLPKSGWPVGGPLVYIKITRFNDGTCALSQSVAHVVGDAVSCRLWSNLLMKNYVSDEPFLSEPDIRRLSTFEPLEYPSSQFSADRPAVGIEDTKRINFFIDHPQLVKLRRTTKLAGISAVDMIRALIVKTFNDVCKSEISVQMVYNARYVQGSDIPKAYTGNSNLKWKCDIPKNPMSIFETASLLKAQPTPTAQDVKREIALIQKKYEENGLMFNGGIIGATSQQSDKSTLTINIATVASLALNDEVLHRELLILVPEKFPFNLACVFSIMDASNRASLIIPIILDVEIVDEFERRFSAALSSLGV